MVAGRRAFAALACAACVVQAEAATASGGALKFEEREANLVRMGEALRWLNKKGPAPSHWVIDRPLARTRPRGGGARPDGGVRKDVNATIFGGDLAVVVKAARAYGRKNNFAGAIFSEVAFLEYCRGLPGVPRLYGGYRDGGGRAVIVVEDGGDAVGRGTGRRTDPTLTSPAFDAAARREPLKLARSILECFRSFSEIGGFFLSDFKADQFALRKDGAVLLVDGPAIHRGDAAEAALALLLERGKYARTSRAGEPFAWRWGDRRSGGEASAPPALAVNDAAFLPPPRRCADPRAFDGDVARAFRRGVFDRCAVTPPHHACVRPADADGVRAGSPVIPGSCEAGSAAAPEAAGLCVGEAGRGAVGRCAPLSPKTHVYDVAAKAWLLPRIIDLAEDGAARGALAALSARMTRPDPDDRPSFSTLLAALGAGPPGS